MEELIFDGDSAVVCMYKKGYHFVKNPCCLTLKEKLLWLGICFCISNTCGVWLNRVGRDRETKEECDEDC